jgi:hypothetical protein
MKLKRHPQKCTRVYRRLLLGSLVLASCLGLAGETAAGQAQSAVWPAHPRLFFRADGQTGQTVSLATLRKRAADPRLSQFVDRLTGSLPNLALRSVLLDDGAAAAQAVAWLVRDFEWKQITTDEGVDLCYRAMAFDWLFDRLSETDRQRAAKIMVAAADRLIREQESGGHIFHTRMYGWATATALAGLALDGHHPEAPRLWKYGAAYYRDRLFPARRLQDGSVHNGFGYGRKYTLWMTGHFISCWLSATGEDLWKEIKNGQDDWARRETQFLIYGRYPDGSYLRFGDSYSLLSDAFSFRAAAERTAGYDDPVGQGFLNQLLADASRKRSDPTQSDLGILDPRTAYTFFLFYDPDRRDEPATALPPKALFSRDGTGMVLWKTGWGKDDTTVFFKCGDYFENHGHFDQGHLDLFRRAPLLIDSGSYLTFDGPFRTEYWHRTVAHNSVLVLDPAQPDEGGQRVFSSQSDTSLEAYRNNPLVESGSILDYEVKPGLAYAAGDYTKAYTSDRVRRITRELTFVDDRYVLVVDRVSTAKEGLVPTVLWHCPVEPQMAPTDRWFQVSRSGARARVQVLHPADATMSWVKGFRVAGREIEPVGQLRGLSDMGVGRVEVTGPQDVREHLFVHLIDIADDETPAAAATCRVAADSLEVAIGDRRLRFRADRPGMPVPVP